MLFFEVQCKVVNNTIAQYLLYLLCIISVILIILSEFSLQVVFVFRQINKIAWR